jgi:hypothetical protein
MVPGAVGVVGVVCATISSHAGRVPSGLRVIVGAFLVVIVQVSWRTWGVFWRRETRQPKLANSSSTNNRTHSEYAMAKFIAWVCSTLPRPTMGAISVAGASRIRAATATAAAATAVSIAISVAPAVPRRRVMPVLIHDGDRIQRECGIGLGRAMRLQDGSHLEAKNVMQQRWRIGAHLAKPIN